MARRKNTKFIDPRYFMDEKMERMDEAVDPHDQPAGGADSLAQKKKDCKGKWMEPGDKGFDTYRGKHGYCEKKKLDEYGATPEMQMPEAFVDQPGDEMGQKLWKDAMRHRWEQYLAGDKSAFDQLSPELRKELGLPQ